MKIILDLVDDQYPFVEVRKTRHAARGVVLDSNGRVALTHLFVEVDKFGGRNYYELPGGGLKDNEHPLAAAKREMEEELGLRVKFLKELGCVHDFYNLIFQENYSHYFLFTIEGKGQKALEPRESLLIDRVDWLELEEAIDFFESYEMPGVGLLVKRRELPILKLAKQFIEKTN